MSTNWLRRSSTSAWPTVASWDQSHTIHLAQLLRAGYYALTEKPVATSLVEMRWMLHAHGQDARGECRLVPRDIG
jgi:hypothetical protein